MTKPALKLLQPDSDYVIDAQTLSATDLRSKYKSTYSSWQNTKSRAKQLGQQFAAEFFDFPDFLLRVGPRPTPAHSLDRIDGTKGYVVGNVRWADKRAQTRNRSNTQYIVVEGTRLPLAEFAERTGQNLKTLHSRRDRGWADREIIAGQQYTRAGAVGDWPWPGEAHGYSRGNALEWERLYQAKRVRRETSTYYLRRYINLPGLESRPEFLVRICSDILEQLKAQLGDLPEPGSPYERDLSAEQAKPAAEAGAVSDCLRFAREQMARAIAEGYYRPRVRQPRRSYDPTVDPEYTNETYSRHHYVGEDEGGDGGSDLLATSA